MTRTQLAELRLTLIDQKREALTKAVSGIERKLYNTLFDKILSELKTEEGKILSNNSNIDLVAKIDNIFKEFNEGEYLKVIKIFARDLQEIGKLNKEYFSILEEDQNKLNKISREVESIMSKRLGLNTKGEIVKDGYLDKLIKDNTLRTKVKEAAYKSVTAGQAISDFKEGITKLVVGTEKVNGGLMKHFNQFAFDTYNQFDRGTQSLYANKIGLTCFIYQGGKIKTSRSVCRKRDGKVFTIEEAMKWKNESWDGKPTDNYEPLIDMGGHGCRHQADFISNAEAIRRRPELEGKL